MTAIEKFIGAALSADFPPRNPLLLQDWAALAFDRNRYECLAPSDLWDAWLSQERASRREDEILVISYEELRAGKEPIRMSATLDALEKYWRDDMRFLSDHYVVSPSHEWIVRLDQDVTLFAGRHDFVAGVVRQIGGREAVEGRMAEDFDPGPDDEVHLGKYVKGLLRAV